jgi:hypothetical protein
LWAQGVTTASINGIIRDKKGEALPGASVVAVHQPTGSQYGAVSRADGRFTIPNAKVGGPYKINVSFVGFEPQDREGIFLTLGNSTDVDFSLTESGTQLQEIQVVSSKSDVFNSDRTGASTNISNQEITRLPTISRSFNDYVRLTPQANANSFGGRSDGFNNITVDGALFNNSFGLSGTVGGQANAQPISLDAVDQITTAIAPYDVKEGSFTGAGINVVTRSGTNEVTGSVYYFFRNQNLAGKKVSGNSNPLTSFDFKNVGFRLGGPIIKNKLFFFVNYERERRNDPGTQFSASRGGSSGPTVSQVQATDLDDLRTFLIESYQYDPGPYEGYKLQSNSDKATAKIDWNISTQHKFTIKYNYLNSYRDVVPSNSGSLGGTRNPSQTGLPFLGAYYRINNNLNSVIAELNSTFGGNLSNKLQVGYTAFRDFRETPTSSRLFPLVDIGNGSGSFLTAFGYEPFSAYNILNSNVLQLSDNFDIYKGSHTLTLGTYNEFYHFENGFDPFYYGAYQFTTLGDFYASAIGTVGSVRQYQLGYSTAADGSFPLVKVNAYQLGFYLQDKIDMKNNFSLTYGIRADVPTINTQIARNVQAAGYSFRDGQQILTDQVQKTQVLWSPRVGFNWDVKGDKSTQLRGGSGIFTGRVPYVWISNQASNNGLLFGSQFYNTVGATGAGILFQPDVNYYRPGQNGNPPITTGPPTYNLAVTSSQFKFPQIWRTNLAIDQRLPGAIVGSLDVAVTQDINAVYHQNINLPNPTKTAAGADTRPIFYQTFPNAGSNSTNNSRINTNVTDAILMRNTSKPFSYFITTQFRKSFSNGLDAMLAYTYTQSKSVNDGGSIAQSIWRDRAINGDPNDNALGFSNYLKPHRIIASLNYRKEYAGMLGTSVGLFYELSQTGTSGGIPVSRFSYVYSGDMNGDNAGGNNDLLYIPKAASDIVLTDIVNSDATIYTAAQQWADLDSYIQQDKYLSKHRGDYAERNGALMPWRGQLDLRILQDVYIKAGEKRNTIQVSLDLFNAGNLVNSNWGFFKTYNRNNLITFKGYDAAGVPQFQYPYLNAATKTPLTSTFRDDLTVLSRWQMQIGVRYIFN